MVLICIKHLVIFFFYLTILYQFTHPLHCCCSIKFTDLTTQVPCFQDYPISSKTSAIWCFISSHRYCFLPIHCNVMDLWFNNTVIQVHRIRQGYRMTSDGNYLLTKLSNVSPFCTQSWQCYHWTHSTVDQYLHVQPLNELTEISNLIDLAVSLLVHPHW